MVKTPARAKLNAIVVCCTPNWLPLAGATLLSCVQNGGAESADFYVLTSASNAFDRQQFASFTKAHGFAAKVIDLTLPKALASFPTARFSTAALLRLTIDQHLPAHYTRVLYLDCDILCEGSVAEIFAADLHDKSLGAVEDYQSLPGAFNASGSHIQNIGLPTGARYFNSGVLLFDWKQTLKRKMLPHCVAHILEMQNRGESYNLPDQDVLNLEFVGDWQPLNLKFNLMAFFVDYFAPTPVFRHFSNKYKPWHGTWLPGLTQYRARYETLLADSPWPNFVVRRFNKIAFVESIACVFRRVDFISRKRFAKHFKSAENPSVE
jgi:lipopolysaccharide biosynthesis glycosyltransferase